MPEALILIGCVLIWLASWCVILRIEAKRAKQREADRFDAAITRLLARREALGLTSDAANDCGPESPDAVDLDQRDGAA